jgi:hypothetical protein
MPIEPYICISNEPGVSYSDYLERLALFLGDFHVFQAIQVFMESVHLVLRHALICVKQYQVICESHDRNSPRLINIYATG